LPAPRHLLVFRFSSLGDVAMTVPVIQLLLHQYPQLQVTVVSTAFVKPLFADIERLHFVAAELKGTHKGFTGLYRLYQSLKKNVAFDAVADFHNVLRTKMLRSFMLLDGKPIAVIDKGRAEKKALTRPQHKVLQPLKTTFERYADVLAQLQLPIQLKWEDGLKAKPQNADIEHQKKEGVHIVGIAPFAQYERKMYPLDKMKAVISMLSAHPNLRIYLFGGRGEAALEQWANEQKGVLNFAGKMSFSDELEVIANLDVMVSMDSANMHLASLYGVPVVSIWGATHPYAGFYGWGQKPSNAVQIDLYCRPCSVFGNKPGPRNDLQCMHSIAPMMVYQKVMEQIERQL
jgi:ADP-heptose:LPS heptosyltransferase